MPTSQIHLFLYRPLESKHAWQPMHVIIFTESEFIY